MSSPVALVCTHPKPSAGRLAPVWGSRVTSQPAGQEGLEPPTAGFGDRDSSQLSYCPLLCVLRSSAGMLAQPDGEPPDVEVYVADPLRVEPCSILPAVRPGCFRPANRPPRRGAKMLAMASTTRVSAR